MKQQDKRYYKKTKEQPNEQYEKQPMNGLRKRLKKCLSIGSFTVASLIVLGTILYCAKEIYVDRMLTEEFAKEQLEPLPDPIIGAAAIFPSLPIREAFLTINEYSRPGIALTETPQYIVIHYTANPGSTAEQNRNYFENLKDTGQTYASAQFVIGLDGEIIQCVPCNEIAYCSNEYNARSLSIEMCHPDEEGNFNDATYNSCVYLVARLMNYYHMDRDHLIRHYDVTGKNCPKYFVEHEDRWEVFKDFVEQYREQYEKENITIQSQVE